MRVLSPRMLPPVRFELGSMASTATRWPAAVRCVPRASMNVDLPTPGTPVMPDPAGAAGAGSRPGEQLLGERLVIGARGLDERDRPGDLGPVLRADAGLQLVDVRQRAHPARLRATPAASRFEMCAAALSNLESRRSAGSGDSRCAQRAANLESRCVRGRTRRWHLKPAFSVAIACADRARQQPAEQRGRQARCAESVSTLRQRSPSSGSMRWPPVIVIPSVRVDHSNSASGSQAGDGPDRRRLAGLLQTGPDCRPRSAPSSSRSTLVIVGVTCRPRLDVDRQRPHRRRRCVGSPLIAQLQPLWRSSSPSSSTAASAMTVPGGKIAAAPAARRASKSCGGMTPPTTIMMSEQYVAEPGAKT